MDFNIIVQYGAIICCVTPNTTSTSQQPQHGSRRLHFPDHAPLAPVSPSHFTYIHPLFVHALCEALFVLTFIAKPYLYIGVSWFSDLVYAHL